MKTHPLKFSFPAFLLAPKFSHSLSKFSASRKPKGVFGNAYDQKCLSAFSGSQKFRSFEKTPYQLLQKVDKHKQTLQK